MPSEPVYAWPSTPRKDESQYRRTYEWDGEGFVPPGLCERVVAAFQRMDGYRYLRDASGSALVWQRGALLELSAPSAATVTSLLIELVPLQGGSRLTADVRGVDPTQLHSLLATGAVHSVLAAVLAGFAGLHGDHLVLHLS